PSRDRTLPRRSTLDGASPPQCQHGGGGVRTAPQGTWWWTTEVGGLYTPLPRSPGGSACDAGTCPRSPLRVCASSLCRFCCLLSCRFKALPGHLSPRLLLPEHRPERLQSPPHGPLPVAEVLERREQQQPGQIAEPPIPLEADLLEHHGPERQEHPVTPGHEHEEQREVEVHRAKQQTAYGDHVPHDFDE